MIDIHIQKIIYFIKFSYILRNENNIFHKYLSRYINIYHPYLLLDIYLYLCIFMQNSNVYENIKSIQFYFF